MPKDDVEKITKLEIHNPGKDKDGSKPTDVTLEKKGDDWEVTAPVAGEGERGQRPVASSTTSRT